MAIVTIESAQDIALAVEQLAILEFTAIYFSGIPILLRRKPKDFTTLFQAIIGQQVSVASAAAIWTRVEQAGLAAQSDVARATPEHLAQLGLHA